MEQSKACCQFYLAFLHEHPTKLNYLSCLSIFSKSFLSNLQAQKAFHKLSLERCNLIREALQHISHSHFDPKSKMQLKPLLIAIVHQLALQMFFLEIFFKQKDFYRKVFRKIGLRYHSIMKDEQKAS